MHFVPSIFGIVKFELTSSVFFSVKTLPIEELDRKHFAKGYQPAQRHTEEEAAQQVQQMKEVALAETQLQRLCELLKEVRKAIEALCSWEVA